MILDWLADRLSSPAEPIVRTNGRRLKGLTAKHYRMVADYLDGVGIKHCVAGTGTGTLYRTLRRLDLKPERKRERTPLR